MSGGLEAVRTGKLKDAVDDLDDVLRCYGRIRDHLQRVLLNTNLSMWRTVDTFATDNRLDRLRPAMSACYSSAQASQIKRGPCTANTRINVLDQMACWVEKSGPGSLYWMSGMAGTGKTTISYSLCQQLECSGRLAASFFCSRVLPECRSIDKIIPSIAYQLARFSRPFRFALSDILETDPDAHTRLPSLQFEALIVRPLLRVYAENTSPTCPPGNTRHSRNLSTNIREAKLPSVADSLPEKLVVVIDALDECENKAGTRQILDLFLSKPRNLPIKFVVSSRPEPEIRDLMIKQTDQAESRVVLHELDKGIVKSDIESYFWEALAPMHPTSDQITALVERAGGLFISAATIARYIGYDNFQGNPHDRLENVLTASSGTEKKHKDIDELYIAVLQAALDNPELEPAEIEDRRQVLHIIICAKEPLTVNALSVLLGMKRVDRVHAALRPMWSVLHVSSTSGLVAPFHASFPEFMLNPSRSKQYSCDLGIHHRTLALGCFDCFRDMSPQFNICRLESSFVFDDEVGGLKHRVKDAVTFEVSYAARYWAIHFHSAIRSPDLLHRLEKFLSTRLLLWMEVMNLKYPDHSMLEAIELVEEYGTVSPDSCGNCTETQKYSEDLTALIYDVIEFVRMFAFDGNVSESTPHIYISMLLFWPESSPIARCYGKRTQGMTKVNGTAIARRQQVLLATRYFPDCHDIRSPIFSPDGTQIAVGIGNDVLLLNASTGRRMCRSLKGHSDTVFSIQFSPDGTRIVSGSQDKTLRVWSTHSGELMLGPLIGHTHQVTSVAFSPDSSQIVSGSYDGVIYLWDAFSGKPLFDGLTSHKKWITTVKYCPNGRYIFSSSLGLNIVCDSKDGQVLHKLCQDGPDAQIRSSDISPDGTRVAYGLYYKGIHVWDIQTGKIVLRTHPIKSKFRTPTITCLSFSHNGSWIASGLDDLTVCVWDAQSGDLVLGPLVGHTYHPTCMNFSPDDGYLVSGSKDQTLRLWDIRDLQKTRNLVCGHANPIHSISATGDGTRIASISTDGTVCVWDVKSGELLLGLDKETFARAKWPTGEKEYVVIKRVSISPDGTHVIVNTDHGPFVLNVSSGTRCNLYVNPTRLPSLLFSVAALGSMALGIYFGSPLELKMKHSFVALLLFFILASSLLMIMGSGGLFAFAFACLIRSDIITAINGHKSHYFSFSFLVNRINVLISHITPVMANRIRTFGDAMIGTVAKRSSTVIWAEFSPDGTRIVSGSSDGIIRICNARTHRRILDIRVHTNGEGGCRLKYVSFSSDSRYIFSKIEKQNPLMHDASSGELLVNLNDPEWENEQYAEFSPDGTRVVVNHWTSVTLIDLASGTTMELPDKHFSQKGHLPEFNLFQLTADSSHMISTRTGGDTCIWDVQTGKLLLRLTRIELGTVTAVAFSRDGGYLITGSDNGSIRVTNIQNAQPITQSSTAADWVMNQDGWVIYPDSDASPGSVDGTSDEDEHVFRSQSRLRPLSPDSVSLSSVGERMNQDDDGIEYLPQPLDFLDPGPSSSSVDGKVDQDEAEEVFSNQFQRPLLFLGSDTSSTSVDERINQDDDEIKPPFRFLDSAGSDASSSSVDGKVDQDEQVVDNQSRQRLRTPDSVSLSSVEEKINQDNDDIEYIPQPLDFLDPDPSPSSADGKVDQDEQVVDNQSRQRLRTPDSGTLLGSVRRKRKRHDDDIEYVSQLDASTSDLDRRVVDKLLWIPADLRDCLMWPRTKQILSRKGRLHLDFEDAYLAESWTKCYRPE